MGVHHHLARDEACIAGLRSAHGLDAPRAALSCLRMPCALAWGAQAEELSMDGREAGPDIAARVRLLREELSRRGVAGFIVPRADEHQGEYVPARARRLAWLTGFTGSAGLAVVLAGRAAIFVDGRYTLQGRGEGPAPLFEYPPLTQQTAPRGIRAHLGAREAAGPRTP